MKSNLEHKKSINTDSNYITQVTPSAGAKPYLLGLTDLVSRKQLENVHTLNVLK